MNVPTINRSNQKLEWSKQLCLPEKKNQPASATMDEPASFVPEFPSPADDQRKSISKAEAQKSIKRNRPFSYTSENWIG